MCKRHALEAEQRRGSASQRGYDVKWRRIRAKFIAAHPWCEWHGPPVRTEEVDHRNGDSSDNRWVNLRPLCSTCHKKRTARDQPGGVRLQ